MSIDATNYLEINKCPVLTLPGSRGTPNDMREKSVKTFLRKVLPWVVAVGLMGYLFYKIPLDNLMDELRQINWIYLLLVVVFVDVGAWLSDSWATSRVFTWYLAPVSWREFLPVRAATYLMAILNYNLGQAGMVYYVHRVKKVPLADVTGIVLMMMGTIILLLSALSVVGVGFGLDEQAQQYSTLLLALGVGALVYFVVIGLKPRWLARRALVKVLFRVGVFGHLRAAAARIPHVGIVVFTHFLALRCFDISVPVGPGLILIPVILLVTSLPLAPFGMGTGQATAVAFFSRYAPGATVDIQRAKVLAYSLSLSSLALALQAVLGLFFLRKVSELISIHREEKEAAEAEAEKPEEPQEPEDGE